MNGKCHSLIVWILKVLVSTIFILIPYFFNFKHGWTYLLNLGNSKLAWYAYLQEENTTKDLGTEGQEEEEGIGWRERREITPVNQKLGLYTEPLFSISPKSHHSHSWAEEQFRGVENNECLLPMSASKWMKVLMGVLICDQNELEERKVCFP